MTDGPTDLLHGAMAALQQVLGCGNAQFLQVNARAFPEACLKRRTKLHRLIACDRSERPIQWGA